MGALGLGKVKTYGERYFEAQFFNRDNSGALLQTVLFVGSFSGWDGDLEVFNKAGDRLLLSAKGQSGADGHLFAGATEEQLIAWVEAWGGVVYAPRLEPHTPPAPAGRVPAPLDAPWRPLALGELIDLLKGEAQSDQVRFDFGGLTPRTLGSYCGYYEQLALGYDDKWQEPMTVGALLAELGGAVGHEYSGWKGGEYTMGRTTPVWAANSGEAPGTGIVGVRRDTYVILETVYIG